MSYQNIDKYINSILRDIDLTETVDYIKRFNFFQCFGEDAESHVATDVIISALLYHICKLYRYSISLEKENYIPDLPFDMLRLADFLIKVKFDEAILQKWDDYYTGKCKDEVVILHSINEEKGIYRKKKYPFHEDFDIAFSRCHNKTYSKFIFRIALE